MTPMTDLRLIHAPARSGATLMCKAIAVMPTVQLYSEIHPRGPALLATQQEHPGYMTASLKAQAFTWFGHLQELGADAVFDRHKTENTKADIDDVMALAQSQGQVPVMRDWSHMDFFGRPFCEPTGTPALLSTLGDHYNLIRTVIVRQPLGMWLSFQGSGLGQDYAGKEGYDRFLDCYLNFIRCFDGLRVHKYEDFMADQDQVVRQFCADLHVDYDPTYTERFRDYKDITGDPAGSGKTSYRDSPRGIAAALYQYLITVPSYGVLCDKLGYDPGAVPFGYRVE
ncbi:MAG: hypothetical protein AAF213_00845 [Pseudomonadota bacterium]